jgi:hypothetical protein
MLRFPFRPADGSRGSLALSALVVVSQVANIAGFVSRWASHAAGESSLAPSRHPQ